MIKPATLPLSGGRFVPFVYTIALEGEDLTDATMEMHVRHAADVGGDPLVDLDLAAANAQGLSFTVDTSGAEPVSTIQIRINETTMEGMPAADETGEDAVFAYDLQITRSGHPKAVFFRGTFTVEAGVTQ
ncbi:MAG TPA: hypothetical protein VD768_08885 [Sphingomicrobium sp.]|nr:hypothetical protein [Sphingomicrobium sp.]